MKGGGAMIELTASDEHKLSAYRADPSGIPKGAVVVVHDIFGINPHIRKVTDDFAASGYIAIAPSLFDRAKSGATLGYDDAANAEGLQLKEQVGREGPLADIRAAVDAVGSAGKIAIVGYGWGGYLAYRSANEIGGLACSIGYYSGEIVDQPGAKRKIPTLLHFGKDDLEIPYDAVIQFSARRPDVSAFSYSAGHGFDCVQRDGYDAEEEKKALGRTLFWISQYVEGQPPIALKNAGAYAQAKTDKKKGKKKGGDDLGPPLD
jgi:carboxymethylenebutenolidase